MTDNGTAEKWWKPAAWKVRDAGCFAVGLSWLAWEVVFREMPRDKYVYIAVLLMLGPAYLQPLADALTSLLSRIMGK